MCRKHYLRWYKHGDPDKVITKAEVAKRGSESPNYKHGLWSHELYSTWRNMLSRCYNPKDHRYKSYGAMGIDVCERWHDINNFIADMGTRPTGLSIDRIDFTKGYSPENCRWADDLTQGRNRRYAKLNLESAKKIRKLKAAGKKRQELADMFGVSVSTIKKVLADAYWKESAAK